MFAAAQLRDRSVRMLYGPYILAAREGVEAAIYILFNERICMTNQIYWISTTHGMYSAPNEKIESLVPSNRLFKTGFDISQWYKDMQAHHVIVEDRVLHFLKNWLVLRFLEQPIRKRGFRGGVGRERWIYKKSA